MSRPKFMEIPGSETPPDHVIYVWENFVRKAKAAKIGIVAHSAGGYCTMALLRKRRDEVLKRLCAIAFTDSVHSISFMEDPKIKQFLKQNAINWAKSSKPLDTKLKSTGGGCPEVSAGHDTHEWTSGSAIESVFKFLDKKIIGKDDEKEKEKEKEEKEGESEHKKDEEGKQGDVNEETKGEKMET